MRIRLSDASNVVPVFWSKLFYFSFTVKLPSPGTLIVNVFGMLDSTREIMHAVVG